MMEMYTLLIFDYYSFTKMSRMHPLFFCIPLSIAHEAQLSTPFPPFPSKLDMIHFFYTIMGDGRRRIIISKEER